MSFVDDMDKASQMFADGIGMFKAKTQELAMQRAIGRANEATQKIKAAEGDEMQKRAQLQQVAQALTMDLAQTGAPAERIAMLAQTISPAPKFYQTPEQAALNAPEGSKEQKIGKDLIGQEMELKKQQIAATKEARAAALSDRQQARFDQAIQGYQKRFDSLSKKNREALDSASTMLSMLESGNPIADSAVSTFAARATGEVGNLTEAERAPFGGSVALHRRIQAIAKRSATGKLTDADRQDLMGLAGVFKSSAERQLRAKAIGISEQAAKTLKRKPDEVYTLLAPESAGPYEVPKQKKTVEKMVRDRGTGEMKRALVDPQTGQIVEILE